MFKNATIGLAVVAGVSLLVAIASTLWFLRQNKSLKQQLADEKSNSENHHHHQASTMHDRASVVPNMADSNHPGAGSVYGGSTTHHNQSSLLDPSHPYYNKTPHGSPPPQHQNPPMSPGPDIQHNNNNLARYSELDGGTANRIEMASPDPYTQQARNSTQTQNNNNNNNHDSALHPNYSSPLHSPSLPQQ